MNILAELKNIISVIDSEHYRVCSEVIMNSEANTIPKLRNQLIEAVTASEGKYRFDQHAPIVGARSKEWEHLIFHFDHTDQNAYIVEVIVTVYKDRMTVWIPKEARFHIHGSQDASEAIKYIKEVTV